MYAVADKSLKYVAKYETLCEAKQAAERLSLEFTGETFFVCDHTGAVRAGFTDGR